MIEDKSYTSIEKGNDRNFGFVFSIFFLVIGLFPLLKGNDIYLWSLIISILFFSISLFRPQILKIPNKLWFKLGLMLGKIISPIVMGIIFFSTVTPIGLIMRLLKKDILNLKMNKKTKSYWTKRINSNDSMKNQF
tara:strand:- start:313 stop:717 length:405 start_codon:yes stop_codon:yes gene_type:complete